MTRKVVVPVSIYCQIVQKSVLWLLNNTFISKKKKFIFLTFPQILMYLFIEYYWTYEYVSEFMLFQPSFSNINYYGPSRMFIIYCNKRLEINEECDYHRRGKSRARRMWLRHWSWRLQAVKVGSRLPFTCSPGSPTLVTESPLRSYQLTPASLYVHELSCFQTFLSEQSKWKSEVNCIMSRD
jgi:hypothetical protein